MDDVQAYFRAFGERVELAYRKTNYAEDDFAAIARDALEASPVHEAVDPIAVLRWAAAAPAALPTQLTTNLRFGQPPVTVYWTPRFVIDVYYWFDATTEIHEHAFSGAFQVLGGASLHAVRRFACERKVNGRFLMGTLETKLSELLEVGATRVITPGNTFAHSLFHLERPSATVVVRTREHPGVGPQFMYLPPHVAVDGFYRPHLRELQRDALASLAQVDQARYWEAFDSAVDDATLEEAFHLLNDHARRNDDTDLVSAPFVSALDRVATRHGARVAEQFQRCFRWTRREVHLKGGRALARNADERFVLGVLLNAHDRSQVLEYVRSRHPERDPIDAFMATFERIAASEDGAESALGFSIGADAVKLIRLLLEGVTPADLPARFLRQGLSPATRKHEAQIREFYETLKGTPALQVLAT